MTVNTMVETVVHRKKALRPARKTLRHLSEERIHIKIQVIEALHKGIVAATKVLKDGHIDGTRMTSIESGHLATCVQKATRTLVQLRASQMIYNVPILQYVPTNYGRQQLEGSGIRTIYDFIFSPHAGSILADRDARIPYMLQAMHFPQEKVALAA